MWRAGCNAFVAAAVVGAAVTVVAQEPPSDADVGVAIDQLGDFDYGVRTRASSPNQFLTRF